MHPLKVGLEERDRVEEDKRADEDNDSDASVGYLLDGSTGSNENVHVDIGEIYCSFCWLVYTWGCGICICGSYNLGAANCPEAA